MAFTFSINGKTYTSDPTNTTVPDGYRFIGYGYLSALGNLAQDIVGHLSAQVGAVNDLRAAAAAQATAAVASAASALAAPGTSTTSTSSRSLALGQATFSVQAGKNIVPGMNIVAAVTASASSNQMRGIVDSYDPVTGVLIATFDQVKGGGNYSAWSISISGTKGDSAGGVGGTSASGSITLTATSPAVQSVTFTALGQFIKLPPANTCLRGVPLFTLHNAGAIPGLVVDADNSIIGFLPGAKATVASLAANADAAGAWVLPDADLVGLVGHLPNTLIGFNTAIRGYSSSDAISEVYEMSGKVVIKGGAGVVAFDPATRQFGTPYIFGAPANSDLIDASNLMITYVSAGLLRGRVLTLVGSDFVPGGEAVASADVSSLSSSHVPICKVLSSTQAVVAYKEGASSKYARTRAISLAGNVMNIGAVNPSWGTADTTSGGAFDIFKVDANRALVLSGGVNAGNAFVDYNVITANGAALTQGAPYSLPFFLIATRALGDQFCQLPNGAILNASSHSADSTLRLALIVIGAGNAFTVTSSGPGMQAGASTLKWTQTPGNTAILTTQHGGQVSSRAVQYAAGPSLQADGTAITYPQSFGPDMQPMAVDASGFYVQFYESYTQGTSNSEGVQMAKYTLSGKNLTQFGQRFAQVTDRSDFGIGRQVVSNGAKRYVIGHCRSLITDSNYVDFTVLTHARLPTYDYHRVTSVGFVVGYTSTGITILGVAK